MPPSSPARRARWRRGAGAALLALLGAGSVQAELPVETLTTERLPADATHRLYVADPAMTHILDGRLHVVDGNSMRYLGMLGTGFSGASSLTPDGRYITVVTTYHSRNQRGPRTDVVEVYTANDLTFQFEVEIPAKHLQGLPTKALTTYTPDGRYLLIQNATPATSITVVDLQEKRFVTETPNPGCYGLVPWQDGSRRFSSFCGDGTLSTIRLDAQGQPSTPEVSAPFFDPDKDPVYTHFEQIGDRAVLVSYAGSVYGVKLSGDKPSFEAPWSFVSPAEQKQGWKPGGYQLFAVDRDTQRLIVGMHPKAIEGSHKNPAEQLWVLDLAKRQRVAKVPGRAAVAMIASQGAQAQLFLLSGADNTLLSFDLRKANGLSKPLKVSAPVGETPIYLGMTP